MHPLPLTIRGRRCYARWTRITSWRRRKQTGRWTSVKRKRTKKCTRTKNTRLKPNQKCSTRRVRNSPRSPIKHRWNTAKNHPRIYLPTLRKTLRPETRITWKIPRRVNMTRIIITTTMEIPINHDTRP